MRTTAEDHQFSFRINKEDKKLLNRLVDKLDKPKCMVIREAIRELAKKLSID